MHNSSAENKEYVKCVLCGHEDTDLLFTSRDRLCLLDEQFKLVKCKFCGLLYLNPRPSFRLIKKYYPENYEPFQITSRLTKNPSFLRKKLMGAIRKGSLDSTHGIANIFSLFLGKLYNSFVHRPIPTMKFGKILDVGCGSGDYLLLLKELGWDTYGVELNERPAEYAKQKLDLNIFIGQLTEANLPTGFFDVVTMWHFLEHAPNPKEIICETRRILKQAGRLIIAVPNVDSLAANIFKENWFPYEVPRHLYGFSCKTITRLLQDNGFYIEKISFNPWSEAKAVRQSIGYWTDKSSKKNAIVSITQKLIPLPFAICTTIFRVGGIITVYAKKI